MCVCTKFRRVDSNAQKCACSLSACTFMAHFTRVMSTNFSVCLESNRNLEMEKKRLQSQCQARGRKSMANSNWSWIWTVPGATDCDGEKKVAKEKCGNRKRRYKGKVTHRICRGEKGKRPKKREQVSERERETVLRCENKTKYLKCVRIETQADWNCSTKHSTVTFVYIGWQAAHKHFPWEPLDALSVLMRITGRSQNSALVTVPVVKETVVYRKQGGASCRKKKEKNIEHEWFIHHSTYTSDEVCSHSLQIYQHSTAHADLTSRE